MKEEAFLRLQGPDLVNPKSFRILIIRLIPMLSINTFAR